jgi:hypothetical protein
VGRSFKYVSLPDMYHLMEGLTFKVTACADVLDSALAHFNEKSRIPDRICSWNKEDPLLRGPLSFPGRGRIIVDITQRFSRDKGLLYLAQIIEAKDEKESAPVVFFSMHSPSLDIPMRTEVPLRALLKGGKPLAGSYSVYLHALICDDGKDFVYYGITKRGWSKRFNEHTTAAVKDGSRRLFPRKMNELIEARVAQLTGKTNTQPMLAGIISSVGAIGLDEDAAMDTEEYLVDKYSLSSKHDNGLNMIPGGREGLRCLHKLSLGGGSSVIETDDRESVLEKYLQDHPQLGIPKPGVAEKWNDPAYAEAVICARENRLSADQVREIRYLAALGNSIDQIRLRIGALDDGQVARVLAGRTYARIR